MSLLLLQVASCCKLPLPLPLPLQLLPLLVFLYKLVLFEQKLCTLWSSLSLARTHTHTQTQRQRGPKVGAECVQRVGGAGQKGAGSWHSCLLNNAMYVKAKYVHSTQNNESINNATRAGMIFLAYACLWLSICVSVCVHVCVYGGLCSVCWLHKCNWNALAWNWNRNWSWNWNCLSRAILEWIVAAQMHWWPCAAESCLFMGLQVGWYMERFGRICQLTLTNWTKGNWELKVR